MSISRVALTVDLVALTARDGRPCVLLVERGSEPYAGRWAFPGGFVEPDEDLRDAALRELAEETGIGAGLDPEQLQTYGAPGRDPRGRTVSVAYLALAADLPEPTAGDDAARAAWWPVDEVQPGDLAFDHDQILADALARARSRPDASVAGLDRAR